LRARRSFFAVGKIRKALTFNDLRRRAPPRSVSA
jgi:hypothetical protein